MKKYSYPLALKQIFKNALISEERFDLEYRDTVSKYFKESMKKVSEVDQIIVFMKRVAAMKHQDIQGNSDTNFPGTVAFCAVKAFSSTMALENKDSQEYKLLSNFVDNFSKEENFSDSLYDIKKIFGDYADTLQKEPGERSEFFNELASSNDDNLQLNETVQLQIAAKKAYKNTLQNLDHC